MSQISFELNGERVAITDQDPAMPLLYALRSDLDMKGPKFGCCLAKCPPMGVGVAATAPVPGAIFNALFDATGIRFRQLPLTPARIKTALGGQGQKATS